MKKGVQNIAFGLIIVSFITLTTIGIRSLPIGFCKFICWLGGCEEVAAFKSNK